MPNPYYVENLKNKTGLEKEVRDYVLKSSDAQEFLAKVYELFDFLIPRYEREGKTHLAISVGCTGGKHRSVVIAEEISSYFRRQKIKVTVSHRDLGKEA